MVFVGWFLLLLHQIAFVRSFYVPGVSPNLFKKDEKIEIKAVKMTSSKTQLPYDFYELRFCKPKTEIHYVSENIGEILRGDRIVNTAYVVEMTKDIKCSLVCEQLTLSKPDASTFKTFIENDYSVHMMIDNLPSATVVKDADGTNKHYVHGYKLGFMYNGVAYINNHLSVTVDYFEGESGKYAVVGFEVEASSIDEKFLKVNKDSCTLPVDAHWKAIHPTTELVQFSYDVKWRLSENRWASRWDIYLQYPNGQVHWFSIINSLVIVFFLAAIISMILVRTLRRDIAKYNRDEDLEDILEESGWKLIHGDVFRPPRCARLLTSLFGAGVQVFCMVFIVIFFAMLGMLSPASRGSLMSAAVFTYVFMGLLAGYFAGRLYKTLRGLEWKSTAIATGMLYPTVMLGIGLLVNSFIWYKGSSAALPFSTLIVILSLWLGISVPLVFVGFSFGYRKRGFELPSRTNQIPRAVPERRFHQHIFFITLLSGLLPFGAVFIELFFIYHAFWESRFYYLFGFLFAVFIILIICCAQVSVAMVYFQLCTEDYHWWWRTFITSGSPALYLLFYSAYYYFAYLDITEFVPIMVYFCYSSLMVITFWILTGTIGFVSAFIFLRHIYSAIKID